VGLVPSGKPSHDLAKGFYVFTIKIKKEIAKKMGTIELQQELKNTELERFHAKSAKAQKKYFNKK